MRFLTASLCALALAASVALFSPATSAAVCPFTGKESSDAADCPHHKLSASQAEVTVKGCTCKGNCGATLDTGLANCDWCYVTDSSCGRFGLEGHWDYCTYPQYDSYEAQNWQDKYNYLWNQIKADQTIGSYANVAEILTESVQTSFDLQRDWFPAGRKKYIHGVGSICPVDFTIDPSSPYSGLFAANSKVRTFVRLGSAAPVTTSSGIVPGLGIKLLRTGVQSGNFVSLVSLDPLPNKSYNFFQANFSNHLPPPSELVIKLLSAKFKQASNCITQVGLSDICSWDVNGNKASNLVFPYKIQLFSFETQLPASPVTLQQLHHSINSIPVGTHLFQVYAYDSPASAHSGNAQHLGTMTLVDNCVNSAFGDSAFFIKHQRIEEDWQARPEWMSQIDAEGECNVSSLSTTPPAECKDN